MFNDAVLFCIWSSKIENIALIYPSRLLIDAWNYVQLSLAPQDWPNTNSG